MDENLVPNFSEADRFLNILDPNTKAFTFQTFPEFKTEDKNLMRSLTKVFHGTFDEFKAKLGALNNFGAGIFVMVNEGDGIIHEGEKSCRCEVNITKVRALYVDLDGAPLKPALYYKATHSMVISTSPNRYHAYWLTDDCPLEQFTLHQKALLTQLNGDPSVCDLPRVMRLPGFYHMKQEPIMVKIFAPGTGESL